MPGKFLRRGAIVDTIKSEQRTNAIQKLDGLTMHPVATISCGCPDPNGGCWHTILTFVLGVVVLQTRNLALRREVEMYRAELGYLVPKDSFLGTDHLLIGAMADGTASARLIEGIGVDPRDVETEVFHLMGHRFE